MTQGGTVDETSVRALVPRPREEVHGGLLWGTWTCACRAGGSAWSRGGAARALAEHTAREHSVCEHSAPPHNA